MKFAEVVARVNGTTTPVFGISWAPPATDVTVAGRVVAFVQTRQVLFSTYTSEVPEECVASVQEIRDFLDSVLGAASGADISAGAGVGVGARAGAVAGELREPLRLMRGYCVRFLDRVGASVDVAAPVSTGRRLFREPRWRMQDYWFGEALGELRAGVCLQVAIIATSFGLDIEDHLASTLPDMR